MGNSIASLLSPSAPAGTLGYKHPEYQKRWWFWEFCRLSYLGGREYYSPDRISVDYQFPTTAEVRNSDGQIITALSAYSQSYRSMLHRHSRETDADYERRRVRSYYYNFVRLTVDTLISSVLAQAPTREGPDDIEEFWDATDEGRTKSMDMFMAEGLKWSAVTGIHWACVDVAETGDGKPYAYWISPLDIWDWAYDDNGNLAWVKQFIYTESKREPLERVDPAGKIRIWYQDRTETYKVLGDGTKDGAPETAPNPLGRIPLVPLYSRRNADSLFPDGVPWAGDLCKIANRVFNLCSQLGQIFDDQTWSQLILPGAGSKGLDAAQLGTARFLQFDASVGGKPEYMSPDSDQARVLMEGIGAALEIARMSVGVGRGRSETSKAVSSADALELESEDKRSVLSDIASEAEDFERRLADLFAAYRGSESAEDVHIQYAQEFQLRTLKDRIDETLSMRSLSLPPAADAKLIEDILRQRFAGMTPDALKEILSGVEAAVAEAKAKRDMEANAKAGEHVDEMEGATKMGAMKKSPPPIDKGKETSDG